MSRVVGPRSESVDEGSGRRLGYDNRFFYSLDRQDEAAETFRAALACLDASPPAGPYHQWLSLRLNIQLGLLDALFFQHQPEAMMELQEQTEALLNEVGTASGLCAYWPRRQLRWNTSTGTEHQPGRADSGSPTWQAKVKGAYDNYQFAIDWENKQARSSQRKRSVGWCEFIIKNGGTPTPTSRWGFVKRIVASAKLVSCVPEVRSAD